MNVAIKMTMNKTYASAAAYPALNSWKACS
jgi:hypothetical protein